MLHPDVIAAIADELAAADRAHSVIPRITARYPDATIEDSYAIQGVWRDKNIAAGRRLVGRKIGLTSKAMQDATGITEPDYGVMFDDTVYRSGAEIPVDHFSNVRVEVELAFVLKEPLEGPDCTLEDALGAIDYAVPALEVLNSHIELGASESWQVRTRSSFLLRAIAARAFGAPNRRSLQRGYADCTS